MVSVRATWSRTGIETYPPSVVTDSGRGNEPVPGLDAGPNAEPGRLMFKLDDGGEVFEVRLGHSGGTNSDWISGPNEGDGFGSSAPADRPEGQHRESIRISWG